MLPRIVSLFLAVSVVASLTTAAPAVGATETSDDAGPLDVLLTIDGARLADSLGKDVNEQRDRIALDSVATFDADGGWAIIDPTGAAELFHYDGVDIALAELTGVTHPAPQDHAAGEFVAALELDGATMPDEGDGSPTDDLGSTDSKLSKIAVSSVETFDAAGGWAVVDPVASNVELLHYDGVDPDVTALDEIVRPDPSIHSSGAVVVPATVPELFPLVVDPPPVTVDVPDLDPVTVDPPPVGGVDLDPLVPDPDSVTVDPSPQPAVYVNPPSPAPAVVDPSPQPAIYVNPPSPAPAVVDPSPQPAVYVDPPPVGIAVDPSPLPPVYVDPPEVGPVAVDPPPQPAVYVNPPSPAPIGIDGPPVGPIYYDPPNPGSVGVDAPPIPPVYLDPPATPPTCVPVVDVIALLQQILDDVPRPTPPDTDELEDDVRAVIAWLQGILDEDLPSPDPGVIIDDLPSPDPEIIIDPNELEEAIAAVLELIGGTDPPPIIIDPSLVGDVVELLEDVLAGIGSGATASGVTAEGDEICVGSEDPEPLSVPGRDPSPVAVAVPDPCPNYKGCQVAPAVDPDPIQVAAPDPCPASSGCQVAPGMNPDPIEFMAPDPCPEIKGCQVLPGLDPDPIKVAAPDPCPEIKGCQVLPGVNPDPIGVVAPDPCPEIKGCQVLPGVDPDPVKVAAPDPCPDAAGCEIDLNLDPPPVAIDPPDPCDAPGVSEDPCYVPLVDGPPVVVDPPGCPVASDPCVLADAPPIAIDSAAADDLLDQLDPCAMGPSNAVDPPGEGMLLKGDGGGNQIWGTASGDIIFGRGGDDAIKGLGGDDILCGGRGEDGVNGGPGNDQVGGGSERDFIVAADGADTVFGGIDKDAIYGGIGADTLSGNAHPGEGLIEQDDGVVDYIAGGGGSDLITPGADDEIHPIVEPVGNCAAVVKTHPTDHPEHYIPRLGVFNPDRLAVKNPQRPCLTVRGTVEDKILESAPDGDSVFHVRRNNPGGMEVTIIVTEILADPDVFGTIGLAVGDRVKVEFMARDYGATAGSPHFPMLQPEKQVTVSGLYILDVGHKDDRKNIREIHPAFYIKYEGLEYYSGKRHAGSPIRMHPKGERFNTPPNSRNFRNKDPDENDDWRYCWDENGNPCRDYNGDPTFG